MTLNLNLLWKSLLIAPALWITTDALTATATELSTVVLEKSKPADSVESASAEDAIAPDPVSSLSEPALAAEPPTTETTPAELAQAIYDETEPEITSVTQLSDVRETDWAYQALRSLVERYGCIVGYPDLTYGGRRFLTRYEFAAGVNACLDTISVLISEATSQVVSNDDLATLQRLQDEFAAELAALRGRVDSLEARTAELEANQFSTTTKLQGEVIFSVDDLFGDDDDNNTVFRSRARLDFVTSFTGEDTLTTRFGMGTVIPFLTPGSLPNVDEGTKEGLFVTRVGGVTDADIVLERLSYEFPLGDQLDVYLATTGGIHSDYVYSTFNPYLEDDDGGEGAITTFGQYSPIYRIGGGAGAGLNWAIDDNETFVLSLGYLADEAAETSAGSGLFNGDYAALGQLTVSPSDTFQLGLTYVHGYHTADNFIFDGGAGDDFYVGSTPASAGHVALDIPAVTNSYGVEASWQIASGFVVSAFGGYTDLIYIGDGDGEIWYYGLTLAFPDLFNEGNLGGIVVGVEPYLGGETVATGDFEFENDTSLHVEAFYKLRVNDNISITPGLVWITAPDQNSGNSDYVVATLRTTFRF